MWRKASISSRMAVEFLVSVFILLTTNDMTPRILGTVNFRLRVFREIAAAGTQRREFRLSRELLRRDQYRFRS